MTDELGVRVGTYVYDAQNRATSTERAGGVDRFSVTFPSATTSTVIDPIGSSRTYTLLSSNETSLVTDMTQPVGSGCAASTEQLSFDSHNNVTLRRDFNGTLSCYANDLSRNLETSRVEGLSTSTACSSVTPTNSTLPALSRKTNTNWHPDWNLQTRQAGPGRLTTRIYNGQPDPFAANAIAACAPSTALLPDGKPIAVMCKEVLQATTDANGSLGFSAALQPGVANRVQQWTYNSYGQVLTAKGPRVDINDTTSYVYYSDTSLTGAAPNAVGHTIGDLQSMTNALGKVTQYTQYNKNGQLLQSVDPNGVVTVNTYDLGQRLLSTSVDGQTTSHTYDPAGQLTRVTQPDASWSGYEYDPAHRITAAKDNLGNRIEYTLDNAGNRTAEAVKDSGGALRRSLVRSIDALGRVQQTTGRE